MSTTIEAYPLTWPDGWPRRSSWRREGSGYRVVFKTARDHLLRQLRLAHGRHVVISSNVPLRRDGIPLAGQREPEDPGVAVYWDDKNGKPRVVACDRWRKVHENLRAIGLTIEAIRAVERSGASELLERAFSGFARLPPAADCWSILGVTRGTPLAEVRRAYQALALKSHPDHGGSNEAMARINAAYAEATQQVVA